MLLFWMSKLHQNNKLFFHNILLLLSLAYGLAHNEASGINVNTSTVMDIQPSSRISPILFNSTDCISSNIKPIIETEPVICPCFIHHEIGFKDVTTWDVFIVPENSYKMWRQQGYNGDPDNIVEEFSARKETKIDGNPLVTSPYYNAYITGTHVLVVRTNTNEKRCFNDPSFDGKGTTIVFETMPKACPMKSNETASRPRIVGGTMVTESNSPDKFEWMALIWFDDKYPICGGVHIGDGYILTAAHCLIQEAPAQFRVRIGVLRASDGLALRISRVFTHPLYEELNNNELINDLAILEVRDKKIARTKSSLPLNQDTSIPKIGDYVTTAGFGHISEGWSALPQPNRLLRVDVPVVGQGECKEAYENVKQGIHLCAGYKTGGCDSCQSDSGGPLRYVGKASNGKMIQTLVGIVSYGTGCARSDKPGVYTRISAYADWVDTTISEATKTRSQYIMLSLPVVIGIVVGVVVFVVIFVLILVAFFMRRNKNAPTTHPPVLHQDVEASDVPSTTGISE